MESIIETPRLRLTRLTNTDLDSDHLKWCHELWTDDLATSWSVSGKTKSLAESQDRMKLRYGKYDDWSWAVHVKATETDSGSTGIFVGSVGLRLQSEPDWPVPPPHTTADVDTSFIDYDPNKPSPTPKPLNKRVLGYSFLPTSWGYGYATEANVALMKAYGEFARKENERKKEQGKAEEEYYVEAGVGRKNPASQKVLQKVGFNKVGWKVESETIILAGEWQEPGFWVYGVYI